MIRLLIFGPTGSMGRLITKLALEDEEIEVVAACDIQDIGTSLRHLVGVYDPKNIVINHVNDLQELIDMTHPNIAVDFTTAEATEKNSIICVKNNIRCVIGTTGLSDLFLQAFETLVKESKTPAVISSNMATGVNIVFKIASLLAQFLQEWDIEIIEFHHHLKRDSPSGTSLTLGKEIAKTLGIQFEAVAKFGREKGPNKRLIRAKQEIGIHAIRA